tara:strand:- start:309 stop:455 length:147 start_codon:yes stop_codon:yes gene_type:complete
MKITPKETSRRREERRRRGEGSRKEARWARAADWSYLALSSPRESRIC